MCLSTSKNQFSQAANLFSPDGMVYLKLAFPNKHRGIENSCGFQSSKNEILLHNIIEGDEPKIPSETATFVIGGSNLEL
jgi:hypothetical protein